MHRPTNEDQNIGHPTYFVGLLGYQKKIVYVHYLLLHLWSPYLHRRCAPISQIHPRFDLFIEVTGAKFVKIKVSDNYGSTSRNRRTQTNQVSLTFLRAKKKVNENRHSEACS